MRYWLSVLVLLGSVGSANAEFYVAGEAGASFSNNLSSVQWSSPGGTVLDKRLDQQISAMYGGKIGYYFDQDFKWLGVETEVYRSTPDLPAQSTRFGSGTIPHIDHSLITWSPLTVLLRLPPGSLPVPIEPYVGMGFGVFFSSLSTQGRSSSSTDLGFTTQAGLRYRVTPNVSVFGEWKYNYASQSHDNLLGPGVNLMAHYSSHLMSFGAAYHF